MLRKRHYDITKGRAEITIRSIFENLDSLAQDLKKTSFALAAISKNLISQQQQKRHHMTYDVIMYQNIVNFDFQVLKISFYSIYFWGLPGFEFKLLLGVLVQKNVILLLQKQSWQTENDRGWVVFVHTIK